MGYWPTARDGTSFAFEFHADGTNLVWGDSVADITDGFLREVIDTFKADVGRAPSIDELIAGIRFAAFGLEEDGDLYTAVGGPPAAMPDA